MKKKSQKVVNLLKKKKLKVSFAESCTGGLLSSTITSVSGSSIIFDYGLVTYSNSSKINFLNISPSSLKKYGAVSEKISEEMINKLSNKFNTNIIYISITGLAGPGGGSDMARPCTKGPRCGVAGELVGFVGAERGVVEQGPGGGLPNAMR